LLQSDKKKEALGSTEGKGRLERRWWLLEALHFASSARQQKKTQLES
jgi:hypothetical protein